MLSKYRKFKEQKVIQKFIKSNISLSSKASFQDHISLFIYLRNKISKTSDNNLLSILKLLSFQKFTTLNHFRQFPQFLLNWTFSIRHYGLQLVISHTANPDNNALRHVSFKYIRIRKATHWP